MILGADELRPYLEALSEVGYCKIPAAFSSAQVSETLSKILELERTLPRPPSEKAPFLNQGHELLYNLQSQDIHFLRLYLKHPTIRALLIELLNDRWYRQIPSENPNFILRSLLARTGGKAPLPLHIDSFLPSSGSMTWSLQVSIVLESQNSKNGCPVFVPGSHRSDRYAVQEARKDAVEVNSEPGDVLIWDSRVWHGTTANESGGRRWAVIATFARWWLKQNYNITASIPEAIYASLSVEEKTVLGYCSIPPFNEFDRIDMKGGYADLKPSVKDYS